MAIKKSPPGGTKMKCSNIKKLLSGYLDGDLEEKESIIVSDHLKICANCSRELDLLKETISLIKIREPVTPPPDFVFQIRKKIEARRWWKEALKIIFYPWHIKIPAEAIATVVIVCALYLMYHEPVPLKKPEKMVEKPLPITETTHAPELEFREEAKEAPSAKREKSLAVSMYRERAVDYYKGISRVYPQMEQGVKKTAERAERAEYKELILTLKNPKKDILKIKKYILLLDAKETLESSDESAGERIINFQIKRKNYPKLTEKLIQMGAIKPQDIPSCEEEDITLKLKIR